jgi:excisionase family DNA binding protein
MATALPEVVGRERQGYSVEEAAELLGVGRTLAYRAISRNEIPHVRIGRRVIVPARALERLLDGGATPTTQATERRNSAA